MIETVQYIRDNLTEAEKWGQLAEEAAELSQAALKMQRLCMDTNKPRMEKGACIDAVIEEHADVALCFKVLAWQDKYAREQIMDEKANRWANHIADQKRKEAGA